MSQTFKRIVDRKDAIVQSLAKDLEEAEEQYQVALRTHLQNVDELIGMLWPRVAVTRANERVVLLRCVGEAWG